MPRSCSSPWSTFSAPIGVGARIGVGEDEDLPLGQSHRVVLGAVVGETLYPDDLDLRQRLANPFGFFLRGSGIDENQDLALAHRIGLIEDRLQRSLEYGPAVQVASVPTLAPQGDLLGRGGFRTN